MDISRVSTSAQDPRSQPGRHAATGEQDDQSIGFLDLLDAINPLQQIPIVGNVYRALTGDEIKPEMRILGGAMFGGPIGAGLNTVQTLFEESSGTTTGEQLTAMFTGQQPHKNGKDYKELPASHDESSESLRQVAALMTDAGGTAQVFPGDPLLERQLAATAAVSTWARQVTGTPPPAPATATTERRTMTLFSDGARNAPAMAPAGAIATTMLNRPRGPLVDEQDPLLQRARETAALLQATSAQSGNVQPSPPTSRAATPRATTAPPPGGAALTNTADVMSALWRDLQQNGGQTVATQPPSAPRTSAPRSTASPQGRWIAGPQVQARPAQPVVPAPLPSVSASDRQRGLRAYHQGANG